MASSNKTQHYDLSQFVPLDKPAWLGDYNSDMQKIDAGIYAAQTKADSLETEVETASAAATAAQQAAQSASEAAQQASDKAQDAQNTANGVSATASQALTTAQQAQTTAQQAQTAASGALQTSGGTMTGPLVLNGDPTENLQAATKQYVDNNSGPYTMSLSLANEKYFFNNGTSMQATFYGSGDTSRMLLVGTLHARTGTTVTDYTLSQFMTSRIGKINEVTIPVIFTDGQRSIISISKESTGSTNLLLKFKSALTFNNSTTFGTFVAVVQGVTH